MLAAATITAPALLEIYLDRIARLDPQLRSYRVVLAETARQEALAAQRRLDAGERLPLLGVPVAIKDDNDVAGELTACGSSGVSAPAAHDAEVVSRLRAVGAVIIGKTNVPELMIFPFTESLTFGVTRNPWNTALSPGGSSGGSGAAVAAGLAPLALGSDGGGSIRIPSGWCGLFGIKPPTRPGLAGAARGRLVRAERQRSARPDGRGCCVVPGRDHHHARPRRRASSPLPRRTRADCELR